MSILCPFAIVFSNASTACPEARKQCTCEALICMSCHKQVQRWKCAAFVREGLHTLPNIPSRPCRIAVDRPYPASASNRRSITGFCNNPCYTSVAGLCADASLGTASAQTSHDCQGLVCVWWLPWVSGRAAPRPQYKYYCTSSQRDSRRRQTRYGCGHMPSRIHRHKTLRSHCKHSLMKHPEMRVAHRSKIDEVACNALRRWQYIAELIEHWTLCLCYA
jgi:hypothetical protein